MRFRKSINGFDNSCISIISSVLEPRFQRTESKLKKTTVIHRKKKLQLNWKILECKCNLIKLLFKAFNKKNCKTFEKSAEK